MTDLILPILAVIRVLLRSRRDTALEVLALRQQVAVLKRKRPRPKLNSLDRLIWTTLHRFWSRWSDVLVIVKPETVIGWHRAGFHLYWRGRSRPRVYVAITFWLLTGIDSGPEESAHGSPEGEQELKHELPVVT